MAYNGVRYGQGLNVIPVLAPVDQGNAGTDNTSYVDLKHANWLTFLVMMGNMTSDASDTVTFVCDCSTDGSTTGNACAFKYRLSAAVGTNTWGDITDATSDGAAIVGATDDNKAILIDVDPAVVLQAKTGACWARLECTNVGPISLISVCAFVEQKYPGNTIRTT
jgi:hypothetical protein